MTCDKSFTLLLQIKRKEKKRKTRDTDLDIEADIGGQIRSKMESHQTHAALIDYCFNKQESFCSPSARYLWGNKSAPAGVWESLKEKDSYTETLTIQFEISR